MEWTSTEEEQGFDEAVRAFCEHPVVEVTVERLARFLRDTAIIQMEDARRLRCLAIALEGEEFVDGWRGLRRIYQSAAEAAPNDAWILHSWGVAANYWAGPWKTEDTSDRVAIAAEAEEVLTRALVLAPRESMIAHSLGLALHGHPLRDEDEWTYTRAALAWFQQAVAWDPSNVIAQLYLAHSYHDLMDWQAALQAYEQVDLERLAREWAPWRALKCRELIAACHASLGHVDEAVRRFTVLLEDVDAMDEQATIEDVADLDELVAAVIHDLHDPELLLRTRSAAHRLNLERRYPRLFPGP